MTKLKVVIRVLQISYPCAPNNPSPYQLEVLTSQERPRNCLKGLSFHHPSQTQSLIPGPFLFRTYLPKMQSHPNVLERQQTLGRKQTRHIQQDFSLFLTVD